jgi:hypothetical protein
MKKFADFVQDRLSQEGLIESGPVLSLSKTDRYVMYKAGPILSVNVSLSKASPGETIQKYVHISEHI